MRLRPCGDAALLVELDDLAAVIAMAGDLWADRTSAPAVSDLVPAARTILVRFDPSVTGESEVAAWVRGHAVNPSDRDHQVARSDREVELPVRYDGADLDEVGQLTGLGRAGVIAAHTARPWTVAFLGFAPGFAYCTGGDPRLRVPRRADPRERVAPGAVGLADDLTAVYPRASPGGWQIIGHTASVVWDLDRDPPALLMPGTLVRFQAT